jgi:glycosyltransferase involved in cell wall biosynthesis
MGRWLSMSVSVLIPVFNRHKLVAEAIASALGQQVAGLEVVAVDNHSDDGTWELLQTYRDSRLKVVRNPENLGLFGNFNRSAEYASGKYTLFLCSDDRLAGGFLSSAVALMEANPGVALLSSRGRYVGLDGLPRDLIGGRLEPGLYDGKSVSAAWFWASYFLGTNIFNYPSGILIRTSILRKCLPFDATLGCPADIDIFLRILQQGDLLISESMGCAVTQHDGQETNVYRRNADLLRQQFLMLERYRPELEAVGAYESLSRQIATLVLSTMVRIMKVDRRLAAKLYAEFGTSIFDMLDAAARRIFTRLHDRWGSLTIPYIVRRGSVP